MTNRAPIRSRQLHGPTLRAYLVLQFQWIALQCWRLDSPLYTRLLLHTSLDIARGGPSWRLLRNLSCGEGATPLRLMAAAHRLALSGQAPELAAHYPSTGGQPGPSLVKDFQATVAANADLLAGEFSRGVQTNEVGRAALLYLGLREIVRRQPAPVELLEIGASAGLNLLFDRYRYVGPNGAWGPEDSPVRTSVPFDDLKGDEPLSVMARRGCDRDPVNVCSARDQMVLRSFVWADQRARAERLEAALGIARSEAPAIDAADAVPWLEEQLRHPREGVTTVLFHSCLWIYLSDAARGDLRRLMAEAASKRGRQGLAWLRFEPVSVAQSQLQLELLPANQRVPLARAGHQGY